MLIDRDLEGRRKEFYVFLTVCLFGFSSVQQCISDTGWLEKVLVNKPQFVATRSWEVDIATGGDETAFSLLVILSRMRPS